MFIVINAIRVYLFKGYKSKRRYHKKYLKNFMIFGDNKFICDILFKNGG